MNRDELRDKQDELVKLARKAGHSEDSILSIEYAGSPTIGQLDIMLYPEYEGVISRVTSDLQAALDR